MRKKTVSKVRFSDPPSRRAVRARAAYVILDACFRKLGQWAEAPVSVRLDAFLCGLSVAGYALEIRRITGKRKQWVRIVRRTP